MSGERRMVVCGGTVLTLDERAAVVREGDVVVAGSRIAAVGRGAGATAVAGVEVLDVAGDFVLPGLVQGHVHLGQTLFRGLAERRRLLAWLRERIWPLEAAHDDESAYWCARLGAAECLLSGTTTIQDIGLGPGAAGLLQAIADSGLRAVAGMCLMDDGEGLPAALAQETERALVRTEELGRRFDGVASGRLRYGLNPRFILSCSDALWHGVRELAARHGWPVHTHALEQQEETAAVRALKGGRDEIEYFAEAGILDSDLRIAHGVWLEERHLPGLAARRCSVVHCPSSNLKLGSGTLDVVRLRRAGVAVGVGTDGAACSNQLDGFAELRLAALLQQERHGPRAFSGLEALRLATSEGARALRLEREIGSLEPGKRADLVVLDGGSLGLLADAASDPHDLVAYGAAAAAVKHVVVDGEVVVRDGRLCQDVEEIRRRASASLTALLSRAGLG